MNKTFNLLFNVKKGKINSAGEAPIYLRITIDGKISEISMKRTSKPLKWNPAMQKVSGSSEGSKSINFYLKTLEQKVYEIDHELMRDKETVTCEALKNKLLGRGELSITFIPVFQDHNNRMEKLVGKEFAPGTLIRYKTTLKNTKEFLKWK